MNSFAEALKRRKATTPAGPSAPRITNPLQRITGNDDNLPDGGTGSGSTTTTTTTSTGTDVAATGSTSSSNPFVAALQKNGYGGKSGSSGGGSTTSSGNAFVDALYANQNGSTISSRQNDSTLNGLLEQYDNLVNSLNDDVDMSYGPNYGDTYHADADVFGTSHAESATQMQQLQTQIMNLLENRYGSDTRYIDYVTGIFDEHNTWWSSVMDYANANAEYYGQFADEDDWNRYLETGYTAGMQSTFEANYPDYSWEEYLADVEQENQYQSNYDAAIASGMTSQEYYQSVGQALAEAESAYTTMRDGNPAATGSYGTLYSMLNPEQQSAIKAYADNEGISVEQWLANKYGTDEDGVQEAYITYGKAYNPESYSNGDANLSAAAKALEDANAEYAWASKHQWDSYSSAPDFAKVANRGRHQYENDMAGRDDSDITAASTPMTWRDYDTSDVAKQYLYYSTDDSYLRPKDSWTSDEANTYYYLYATDPEQASDYAKWVNTNYDNQRNADLQQSVYDFTYGELDENGNRVNGHAGLGFGIGVANSLLQLLTGNAAYADMLMEYAARGDIYESRNNSIAGVHSAISGGTTEALNKISGVVPEDVPVFGGKGLGDVANIFESMAQSRAVAGAGNAVTYIAFFGMSASQTLYDLIGQGVDPQDAILLATIAGAAEAVTEEYSVEKLNEIDATSNLLMQMFQQFINEGAEEATSDLINRIAEDLVLGDKSPYYQKVTEYIAQGMTEDEARRKASVEWMYDVFYSYLAGGLSGAISGGMTGIGQRMTTYSGSNLNGGTATGRMMSGVQANRTTINGQTQASLAAGQLLDQARAAGITDSKAENRYRDSGKLKLSDAQRLQSQITEHDVKAYSGAVANEITSAKVDTGKINVQTLSDAIVKQLSFGEYAELSAKEKRAYKAATNTRSNKALADVIANIEASYKTHTGVWGEATSSENKLTAAQKKVGETSVNVRADFDLDGETVHVAGLTVKDGKISAQVTADSNTYKSVKITELPTNIRNAVNYISAMSRSTSATAAAFNNYDHAAKNYAAANNGAQLTLNNYALNWKAAYEMGARGAKAEALQSSVSSHVLGEDVAKKAFEAGHNDMTEQIKKIKAEQKKATEAEAKKSGKKSSDTGYRAEALTEDAVIKDGSKEFTLKAVSEDISDRIDIDFVKAVAKLFKINIQLYQGEADETGRLGGANGMYVASTDTVYLAIDAGQATTTDIAHRTILLTLSHELTHRLQHKSPAQYKQLKGFIKDHVSELYGEDIYDALIKDELRVNHWADTKENRAAAEDEVTANACELMLINSSVAEMLAQENAGLFANIRKFIKGWIGENKIERTSDYTGAVHTAAKAMNGFMDQLQQIWDNAAVNVINGTENGDNYGESETITESFEEETDTDLEATEDETGPIEGPTAEPVTSDITWENGLSEEYDALDERFEQALAESSAEGAEPETETPARRGLFGNRKNKPVEIDVDSYDIQARSFADDGNTIQFSIRSTSSALGVDAYRDDMGVITFTVDGEPVTEIDAEHIKNRSGIGLLINTAVRNGYITKEDADKQYEAAAGLMNTIMRTNSPELTWAWAGASIFSAVKKNSDGQYSTTIDFTTVCRKTQDMVTAMSAAMKERGRGLTKKEVTELQAEVAQSGAEVPCPVCYVFSRWAGIGGMLDNIRDLQTKYGKMGAEQVKTRIAELEAEIIERGWATKNKKGKYSVTGDGVTKLIQEKNGQRDNLSAELERLELTKKNPERRKELTAIIEELDTEIGILGEWTWAKNIFTRADYKPVPPEVLYDLNAGREFAQDYAAVWAYRTTRGPASGKAIMPYSDMRLGDIILGATNAGDAVKRKTIFTDKNGKVTAQGELTKAQQDAIKSAIARTAAQNLIGGQRFQSTSDFRYEYALDYIQSFWELQALGSTLQTYTKVVEYADIIAAIGGDVNLSVMPRGKGYKDGKLVFSNVTGMNIDAALEANAKFHNAQLILVGINDEHIMLALNDDIGSGGENIGFVIPYHASGASIEDFISELVQNLGETFVKSNYQDYSAVQTDSACEITSNSEERLDTIRVAILGEGKVNASDLAEIDILRGKMPGITGMSAEDIQSLEAEARSGDATAMREYLSLFEEVLNEQANLRRIRKATLTKGKAKVSEAEHESIRGKSKDISGYSFEELRAVEKAALSGNAAAMEEYLSWSDGVLNDLYDKMMTGAEKKTKLTSAQAASIMPHEYWNKATTRSNAYVNGFIFRSYCTRLGLHPRFTGWSSTGKKSFGDFSDSTGYWKTLIDRPMYDNYGRYRDQQRIDVTNFDNGMLKPEYAERTYPNYKIQEPNETRATKVGKAFAAELKQRDAGVQTQLRITPAQFQEARREFFFRDGFVGDDIHKRSDFEAVRAFYQQFQDGIADKDNFYYRTIAAFDKVSRRPRREPDYVSHNKYGEISSEYWYTNDGVIRGSKHWGSGVATCDWFLDGNFGQVAAYNGAKEYGYCKWDNFTLRTGLDDYDGNHIITTFANSTGKGNRKIETFNVNLQLRDNPDAVVGINVNDKTQPFTKEILDGIKTIETRNSPTLDKYIGQRVAIVRTGKGGATIVVGWATITGRVEYTSEKQFREDYQKHRVNSKDEKFGWKGKTKYGYTLANVEREAEPYAVTDRDPGNYTARDVTRDIQRPDAKKQRAVDKYKQGTQFQKRGTTADGIEIYETDSGIANLSYTEKIKRFQENFYTPGSPHYIGQYVQFVRNGKVNYAEINRYTQIENTEKINPAHLNQWDKAKINVGASGDFITLLENTTYDNERTNGDKTKNDAHKVTDVFEYYLKTVYIDSKPFNVVVNVSRKADNSRFVYDVVLKQNKTLPQLGPQTTNNSRRPKVQSTRLSGNVYDNDSTPDTTDSQGGIQGQQRITAEQDARYLELAEDPGKNKAALQKMVDQAARVAGYPKVAFHGTQSEFTKFDAKATRSGEGFWFSDNTDVANEYGPVKNVYLDLGNGLVFDAEGSSWGDMPITPEFENAAFVNEDYDPDWDGEDVYTNAEGEALLLTSNSLSEYAYENGYDSLTINNVYDEEHLGTDYVVYSPNRIKSADAVTYDDSGNVIPLSERFNTANDDIRFQQRATAPATFSADMGNTNGDMAWSDIVADFMNVGIDNHATLDEGIEGISSEALKPLSIMIDRHRGLDFITRIFMAKTAAQEKVVRNDLKLVLAGMNDIEQICFWKNYADYATNKWINHGKWNALTADALKGATTKFRNECKKRIDEILTAEANATNLNFEEREYTFDEIKDLFSKLNTDPINEALAEKVFAICESTELVIHGVTKKYLSETDHSRNQAGHSWGTSVTYTVEYMNDSRYTDQDKANTILHELIHQATTYALKQTGYESQKGYVPPGYISKKLSENITIDMREACKILNEVYVNLKGIKEFDDQYGAKNTMEMVAELSNPDFRNYLQKQSLWSRVVNAIKKFFGIDTTNALDAASRALDYLLDTFSLKAYNNVNSTIDIINRNSLSATPKFQMRDNTQSDIDVLSNTFDDAAQTEAGKKSLAMFRAQLENVDAAEQLVSEALKAVKENDTPVTRKYLQDARKERAREDKVLRGMVNNNADLKKVIKAARAITEEQLDEEYVQSYNQQYNELSNVITGLEGELKAARAETTVDEKKIEKLGEQIAKKEQAIKDLRLDRANKVAEVKQHYMDMNSRRREQIRKSGVREKIAKLAKEMNDRMTHSREGYYIPEDLITSTVGVLEMINTDTWSSDLRLQEIDEQIKKLDRSKADYDQKFNELMQLRDNYAKRSDNYHTAMAKVHAEYEKLKKNAATAGAYDESVSDMIRDLPDLIGDTPLKRMTEQQLQVTYNVLNAMMKVIKDSVKIKIGTETYNSFVAAKSMISELRSANKTKDNVFNRYQFDTVRPQVVFERFGGFAKNNMWSRMYEVLDRGQLKMLQVQYDLSRPFAEIINNETDVRTIMAQDAKGKLDRSKLVDIGLTDKNGKAIRVSLDIAMSIYMDTLNPENAKHLAYGGKIIPNLEEYYNPSGNGGFHAGTRHATGFSVELSDAMYQIEKLKAQKKTAETEAEIKDLEQRIIDLKVQIKDIENEAQGYVKTIRDNCLEVFAGGGKYSWVPSGYISAWIGTTQNLFNVDSKKALDETTKEVYGFSKATVENYYPIRTDPNYRAAQFDSVTKDMSLENVGFMKSRINGSNPTLAVGIVDMVRSQIDQTARYCGLMPAIRNFQKAYGVTDSGFKDSVQAALEEQTDGYGNKYINNLMADLTGSRKGEKGLVGDFLAALRGNLAQSALTLSGRTALSQLASLPTASVVVGRKAILYAMNPANKVDVDEITRVTPLYAYRMRGYVDAELGYLKSLNNPLNRLWGKMRWATGWIQAMDGLATRRLFLAAQYYTENTLGLQKSDETYWQRVAETYNRIIEETQPNYTAMQRPELLRTTNELQRSMAMFMTQRLQNVSIVYDAAQRVARYSKDINVEGSGVTQADLKQAKDKLSSALWSQLAATASIVFIKTAWNMLTSNMGHYRDDDDEVTPLSFILGVADMTIDTIIGNFWLGSNIYSALKYMVSGSGYKSDFISVNGIDTINEVIGSMQTLADKLRGEDVDFEDAMSAIESLAYDICQATGIPAKNAVSIVKGVIYGIEDVFDGQWAPWEASADRTKAQETHRLLNAYILGNEAQIASITETLGGEKAARTRLKSYIKSEFTKRNSDMDEATAMKYLTEYLGMDPEEAQSAVTYWSFIRENPEAKEYLTTASQYANYSTYVADSGLTPEQYRTYLDEVPDTDNNGSISQDELGYYLMSLRHEGLLSRQQAEAIWNSRYHSANSRTLMEWFGNH